MRPWTLTLSLALLASPAPAAQDCNKLMGARRAECFVEAARRARPPARRTRKPSHGPDKYGRYKARLNIKGILPAVEQQALPGDVIRSERGYNNVNINYRNSDHRAFGSFAGKIYPVQYDPATRHYTGWEKMLPWIYSKKTRFPNRKPGQITIKLGKGVTFDRPIVLRIAAKTTQGNYFWTERTVTVQGSPETGYVVPDEIYLDHYGRAPGKSIPARNDPQNRGTSTPPPPSPQGRVFTTPAPPPPPPVPAPPRIPEYMLRPPDLKRGEIFLAGFTPAMAARMASDPVKIGRGNVRIYIKNQGARVWGLVKKTSWKDRPIEEFSMRVGTRENSRISYDRPLVIRAEIRAMSNGRYLTEQVRTIETLGDPFVFDEFVPSKR